MGEIVAKKDIKKGEVIGEVDSYQIPVIAKFDTDKIEFKSSKIWDD